MELLLMFYAIIGVLHANSKVNNFNPLLRPLWASNRSLPAIIRILGFFANSYDLANQHGIFEIASFAII